MKLINPKVKATKTQSKIALTVNSSKTVLNCNKLIMFMPFFL